MRNTLENCGLYGVGFKCFGGDAQGLEGIKPFNVVVGRNNSGKSGLIDLVSFACAGAPPIAPQSRRANGQEAAILVTTTLSAGELGPIYSHGRGGGEIPGNHWEFGFQLVDCRFTRDICSPSSGMAKVLQADGQPTVLESITVEARNGFLNRMASSIDHPLRNFFFSRLGAERDLRPEQVTGQSLALDSDGKGATHLIQAYLTRDDLDRSLVERTLLKALNSICEPDFSFTRISCLLNQQSQFWEIYLSEAEKGDIRLSQSGSGLKTALLTLLMLEIQPSLTKYPRERTIFALEELENNLHPALLRRMLAYLRRYADEHKSVFFLTTHSSVTVDVFANQPDAQIVHVQHDGKDARVTPVSGYLSHRGILDDLDIRASDLLQSNGIIWVEGPSDRRYLNRWIELWSDGELYEGNHYRILFYGGRLLSHFSSGDPAEVESAIALLGINRNLALVMDSDRSKPKNRINTTKMRVREETERLGGLAWVTNGREIENYLSVDVLRAALGDGIPGLGSHMHFFNEYAPQLSTANQKILKKGKVEAADLFARAMTSSNVRGALDLDDQMSALCNRIKKWNRLD